MDRLTPDSADPGLQPERTALAWRRTAWAMLILALLCFRGWLRENNGLYALCGGLLLLSVLAILTNVRHNRQAGLAVVVTLCGLVLVVIMLKNYLMLLS